VAGWWCALNGAPEGGWATLRSWPAVAAQATGSQQWGRRRLWQPGAQGPLAAAGWAGSSSPAWAAFVQPGAAVAAAVAAAAYLLLWSQGVLFGGLNKKRASKLNARAAGLVPAAAPKQSEGTYVSRMGVPATRPPRVPRVWLAFSHTQQKQS
jgi:hypothetical protein